MAQNADLRIPEVRVLGRHLLIELYGCKGDTLRDLGLIKDLMRKAVDESGSKRIGEFFKVFPNTGGITGVIVVAESHFSIHTWPEYGYAALDIFTCGEGVDPWKGYRVIVEGMGPDRVSVTEMKRGMLPKG